MNANFNKGLKELIARADMVSLMSIALISMFVITLVTAYFFPIYPDEIAVRIWLSRLVYDFPERINLYPTCVSAFSQPLPITWLVPGLIEWAVHGNIENLRILRLVGIIIAIFWMILLILALPMDVFEDNASKPNSKASFFLQRLLHSSGLVISIFSIGVFPIFLVTNRQEQLILPAVILLMYLFIAGNRTKNTALKTGVLVVLYFVDLSIILYAHPKGLFLTPFIALIGFVLFRKIRNRGLRLTGVGIVIAHLILAYGVWKNSFQCSEAPELDATLRGFSFDPVALFYDSHYFFGQAFQSLVRFSVYPHQLGFRLHTDIDYLPPIPLTHLATIANVFIRLNFSIAFFTILVLLPFNYYRKDIAHGRFVTINAALITLLVCTILSAVFNLSKNWYDAGYFYALLSVIWIFFLRENLKSALHKTVIRGIFFYLACVALLSQAIFIHRNLPAFFAGYVGPSVSIVNYSYSEMRKDLAVASRTCNINPLLSKGVIVDDFTYPYFQKSKGPMAISYIFYENDTASARRFISEVDSAGLVTRCGSLPEPYASVAKKIGGGVCCISKNDLKNLH